MNEESKRRVWTKEKIALLEEYLDKGLSGGEIGKLLGISRNAVIGKVHRLGRRLSEGKPRPPRRDQRVSAQQRPRPHVPTVKAPPMGAPPLPPLVTAEPVLPKEPRKPPLFADGHWPLLELLNEACRWPCEHAHGKHLFCGKPVVGGKAPYCAEHCRLAGAKYNSYRSNYAGAARDE